MDGCFISLFYSTLFGNGVVPLRKKSSLNVCLRAGLHSMFFSPLSVFVCATFRLLLKELHFLYFHLCEEQCELLTFWGHFACPSPWVRPSERLSWALRAQVGIRFMVPTMISGPECVCVWELSRSGSFPSSSSVMGLLMGELFSAADLLEMVWPHFFFLFMAIIIIMLSAMKGKSTSWIEAFQNEY